MSKILGDVTRRERIADGTWVFHLALQAPEFPFRPGQTMDVTLVAPTVEDAEGNRRTFSIASAPGEGELLFATRVRKSAFKRSLVEATLPIPVQVEGPFGSFTLPNRPGPVVMLAGGIGITPFHSMIDDVLRRGKEHGLTLIHSNHTPADAPFLKQLTTWAEDNPRFRYVPTMTSADGSTWTGERRRVDAGFLADVLPAERDAARYFVAGPEGFVKAASAALDDLGIDPDQVRTEEFPGYETVKAGA